MQKKLLMAIATIFAIVITCSLYWWDRPTIIATFDICKSGYWGKLEVVGIDRYWIKSEMNLLVFDKKNNLILKREFFDPIIKSFIPDFFCTSQALAVCNFCAEGEYHTYHIHHLKTGKVIDYAELPSSNALNAPFEKIAIQFKESYSQRGWGVR